MNNHDGRNLPRASRPSDSPQLSTCSLILNGQIGQPQHLPELLPTRETKISSHNKNVCHFPSKKKENRRGEGKTGSFPDSQILGVEWLPTAPDYFSPVDGRCFRQHERRWLFLGKMPRVSPPSDRNATAIDRRRESTTLTSISVGSDLKGEAEASDLASAEKRRRTIESRSTVAAAIN
ncbi:uncharacterized protein A4U43_C04F18360 [Asparagus officinalis]|uniref:Uncharacterized protein n=1 Tax=Asparagus officinalis TaxID=4686 RepID=A0A5P1F4J5_ASPOF|nr:uncharacterized protein A4U43_C04F18360 [Asparagus officinalis]